MTIFGKNLHHLFFGHFGENKILTLYKKKREKKTNE